MVNIMKISQQELWGKRDHSQREASILQNIDVIYSTASIEVQGLFV